jgi:hypothetical protein
MGLRLSNFLCTGHYLVPRARLSRALTRPIMWTGRPEVLTIALTDPLVNVTTHAATAPLLRHLQATFDQCVGSRHSHSVLKRTARRSHPTIVRTYAKTTLRNEQR